MSEGEKRTSGNGEAEADAPAPEIEGPEPPEAIASEVTAAPVPEDEDQDGEAEAPATPEERIAELEAEIVALKDQLLRAVAETENVRRRGQREREDTAKYAAANFARDIVSVADNLGRALEAVSDEMRKENDSVDGLATGVELTQKELDAAFERHDIKRIEPLGEAFDHNLHQAMFEVEDASQPAGTVVQLMQAGYVMRDRLLRPAMVGISKGGAKPAAPEPPAKAAPSEAAPSEAAPAKAAPAKASPSEAGAKPAPSESGADGGDGPAPGKVDTTA
jgi:molecular chaperone GrpE